MKRPRTHIFFSISAARNIVNGDTGDVEAVIHVKPEDIIYYFCNRHNNAGTPVKYNNVNPAKSVFDSKKETLIQIHGWLDGNNAEFNNLVKEAVLFKEDINVIVADWSKVAKDEYLIVKSQMPKVSEYIGEFVANFTKTFAYPLSKVKLVGHSLGAHISGFVGNRLGGSVSQIVGLDPAGPFISKKDGHCLNKSDAKFVEAIHTCDGKLGMNKAVGHVDYFPNGGSSQPGCSALDVVGKCDHLRSFEFYAESVKSGGFYAKECGSYDDFKSNKCKGPVSLMGGYNADRK